MNKTTEIFSQWMEAVIHRAQGGRVRMTHIVALKGKQGIGKSQLLSRLVGPENLTHFQGHSSSLYKVYRDSVLVEVSPREIDDNTMSWMMAESDCFRAPYAKESRTLRRNFTPIVTGLPFEVDQLVAKNRRFWPVDINELQMDQLEGIRFFSAPATPSAEEV